MAAFSENQYEQLSAYLDRRLSAQEQAALEAQLASDPQLRAELDELRRTVTLVQELPALVPPRSFTLDPSRVARPRSVFSWMRWISAVGACVLFLVIGVSFITQRVSNEFTANSPWLDSNAQGALTATAPQAGMARLTEATQALEEPLAVAATTAPDPAASNAAGLAAGSAPLASEQQASPTEAALMIPVPPADSFADANSPAAGSGSLELDTSVDQVYATGPDTQAAKFMTQTLIVPRLDQTDTSSPDTRELQNPAGGDINGANPAASPTIAAYLGGADTPALGLLFLLVLLLGIASTIGIILWLRRRAG